ncbi:MAG: SMC-Scp complex subunit ScpB [Alcanivorax sp.]
MDSKEYQIRLLEALLFASSEPLSIAQLSTHMPEDTDFKTLLNDLQSQYAARGVHLVNIENKWAFRTAPDLAEDLSVERHVHKKLSRAAMETLSIIAYHQPVTRAEIENIRGVSAHKGTLDVLIEMGWVKPGRRRETIGRPLTWVTTSDFLDHFSLESLTDLPGMDEMKASGLLDRRPAIETIHQDDLFGTGDALPEGDEEEHEDEYEAGGDISDQGMLQEEDIQA